MKSGLDEQNAAIRAWIEDLKTRFRMDIPAIARRANVSASTIYRWFDDEHPFTPSLTSVRKIAQAFGVPMPGDEDAPRGFAEGEASRLTAAQEPAELKAGENQGVWLIGSRSLELAGIIPGDMVLVDMGETPRSGDVVCAQVYNLDRGTAETKFRHYEPPFLMTRTMDPAASERPLFVDNERVWVAGVVIRTLRVRS